MTRLLVRILTLIAALASAPALAQNQCVIPQSLAEGRALFPPPGNKVAGPVTGHILALSWSPQFCKVNGDDRKNADQCQGPNRFGFVLHGLWADGNGRNDPVWCKRVGNVPLAVLKQNFCATPSASLMLHEWAKHGSCIESDAGRYFRAARLAYDALRFPDMAALARAQANVGDLTSAFAAANPGLSADMFRVNLTQLGWLEDVQLCLGLDNRPRACRHDIGGAPPSAAMKIWPAR